MSSDNNNRRDWSWVFPMMYGAVAGAFITTAIIAPQIQRERERADRNFHTVEALSDLLNGRTPAKGTHEQE